MSDNMSDASAQENYNIMQLDDSSVNSGDTSSTSSSVSIRGATKKADQDCACKKLYESAPPNDAKKVLFAMCLGLVADAAENTNAPLRKLGDFKVELYASVQNKKPFRPIQKHLLDEVERRFEVLDIPAKERFKRHNKQKASAKAALDWLEAHPLTNPRDIAFLQKEEKTFYELHVNALAEQTAMSAKDNTGSATLVFNADLRLIHCIIEPDIKGPYIRRTEKLTKQQLDARNAPDRPRTWAEMVSDRFNNRIFEAVTKVHPNLHSNFATAISINREDCPHDVTPEKVIEWLADRRAKLIMVIQ